MFCNYSKFFSHAGDHLAQIPVGMIKRQCVTSTTCKALIDTDIYMHVYVNRFT